MSTAQGWVALGILLAFAGIIVTLILAMLTGLRNEMSSMPNELVARIDGLGETLGARLTALDRDVQAIARRVFDNPA